MSKQLFEAMDEVAEQILSGDITPDYVISCIKLEKIFKSHETPNKYKNLMQLLRDIESGNIYPVKKEVI